MDIFQTTIKKHFYIAMGFLIVGLGFGFLYSLNLLGYTSNAPLLNPTSVRSVHITLMLYGFIPFMLSLLPFLLLHKDLGVNRKALRYIEIYATLWYVTLFSMILSLSMGVLRGLAFYDFHYSLNFFLAFSGIFYILALYEYIKMYTIKPLWVKISIFVVVISPFSLLFLMNPVVGQVEATISGPYGDNTLGMSLALIPIYYLIFKLLSKDTFVPRWHILWIIPAIFYAISVLYRLFIAQLSYEQEWFFQWLSLLYIPLLIRWYKDANIPSTAKKLLFISLFGFLFVDVEGNILFIESIRWIFHRNDIVIAHAHIAMGVGVLFMTLSMYADIVKKLTDSFFTKVYIFGMLGIFISLSLNGFVEAGYFHLNTLILWSIRSISGLFIISSFFFLIILPTKLSKVQIYNLLGFLSDSFGGFFLIFVAGVIYPLVGFVFDGTYIYVVFVFMMGTGFIHLLALISTNTQAMLTFATAIIRFGVSSMFLSLFLANKLGIVALLIAGYDFTYAAVFMIWFYIPKYFMKEKHV